MSTNSNSIYIGAFEAKTKLSELLERVSKGVSFIITKHNKPVARLIGFEDEQEQLERRIQATKEIRELSKRYSLKGMSDREICDLRKEGRR